MNALQGFEERLKKRMESWGDSGWADEDIWYDSETGWGDQCD